jgi:hypothetical protein
MSDSMVNDEREIEWVEVGGNEDNLYLTTPGQYKTCDKIEVYEEPGQMSMVPWVRIFKGDEIWVRIPVSLCAIGYKVSK